MCGSRLRGCNSELQSLSQSFDPPFSLIPALKTFCSSINLGQCVDRKMQFALLLAAPFAAGSFFPGATALEPYKPEFLASLLEGSPRDFSKSKIWLSIASES